MMQPHKLRIAGARRGRTRARYEHLEGMLKRACDLPEVTQRCAGFHAKSGLTSEPFRTRPLSTSGRESPSPERVPMMLEHLYASLLPLWTESKGVEDDVLIALHVAGGLMKIRPFDRENGLTAIDVCAYTLMRRWSLAKVPFALEGDLGRQLITLLERRPHGTEIENLERLRQRADLHVAAHGLLRSMREGWRA